MLFWESPGINADDRVAVDGRACLVDSPSDTISTYALCTERYVETALVV